MGSPILSFDCLAFSFSRLCGFALQQLWYLGGRTGVMAGGELLRQPGAKDVGVRVRVMNAVEKTRWDVPSPILASDK